MNKIRKIYDILYKKYGPQKWWPIRTKNKQFEVIIGAILTQNTSWKNVEKALLNLEKENLISINKISSTRVDKLAGLIKPSGYYNQKAERLKLSANFFSKNKKPTRKQLLAVKGIGPETADSILLYAFNKPIFVIDAYTKRIFSRIGLCKDRCEYNELQNIFHKALPKNTKLFNEYHALLVELAKQNCTKKPDCKSCPISKFCKKFI
ncbi:endonuclease [Candidatus Woesearchaeota archaeon]|nr:endonuclease [Candidatus Woesearchaeota archaeon]